MGDKKKNRDRSRSEQKEKKKSKKKSKQQKRDKDKGKKKKSQRRSRDSSVSSSSSSSSQSQRSRSRNKKKKKKDRVSKQKQEKSTVVLPFSMPQTNPINPVAPLGIRPVGGIIIPPPAPIAATTTPVIKPKTKQYHIFKLFPKLPIGPVMIGRTVYSSALLSEGFLKKFINSMCEQLQKDSKAEGSKKMASLMSKVKVQINSIDDKNQKANQFMAPQKVFKNQFVELKQKYQTNKNKNLSCYIQNYSNTA